MITRERFVEGIDRELIRRIYFMKIDSKEHPVAQAFQALANDLAADFDPAIVCCCGNVLRQIRFFQMTATFHLWKRGLLSLWVLAELLSQLRIAFYGIQRRNSGLQTYSEAVSN